jgi:glutamate racemase
MNRLAIIDWGIGGVSVYKLIKERLGDIPVLYFSDTGATPYGKMTRPELVSRLNAVIEFLKANGATHVVIGCNAASTAINNLNRQGLPVEGVIESAVEFTARLKPRKLGLIGGRRTVLSGVYRRAFAAKGIKPFQRVAQPLSALIESGDISSLQLQAECRRILEPLRNSSHVLLACTHYPAIAGVMKDYVSEKTTFIDPAAELVEKVSAWNLPLGGGDRFLTSGDTAKMKKAALLAFGVEISTVEQVTI